MSTTVSNLKLVSESEALAGRDQAMSWTVRENPLVHHVNQNQLLPPYPNGTDTAIFGMGCFWGAEKKFWNLSGVFSTSVGYCGGFTKHPTYEEVKTGLTGHCEVVKVVFFPSQITYKDLLKVFWEGHDPTQGTRQGIDVGTQYRSSIYYQSSEQKLKAGETREDYQKELIANGHGKITTEITPMKSPFYYAEEYHQQYLSKNPEGFCGVGGTGISCPIGLR